VLIKHGKERIKLSINTAIIIIRIFVLIILGIVIYAWFSPNNNMYKNDDWRTKTGREDWRTKTGR
jgi:amino acid transporter